MRVGETGEGRRKRALAAHRAVLAQRTVRGFGRRKQRFIRAVARVLPTCVLDVAGSPARADSTNRGAERRSILAIGIFQGDLAVPAREQIAAVDFDAAAISVGSRERPLRHSTVAPNKVACVAPLGIGEPD